jgi:hypothetical protein
VGLRDFWKRDTKDPLIRIFLDKYKMHLLTIPREDISVGDLYVYDKNNKAVSTKGSLTYFLKPKLKIPPLTNAAAMADVANMMTDYVDFTIGLDLLNGFLGKFGIGSVIQNVETEFRAKKAKTIAFNFPNCSRDSVDSTHLGYNLIGKKPIKDHPLYNESNRYFVVMAVARTSEIKMLVQDNSKHNINVDASVLESKLTNMKSRINKDKYSAVTFNGAKPLGFAVELQELRYDAETKKILLVPAVDPLTLRFCSSSLEKEVFVDS